MSNRITVVNLRNLCEHLNKITGSPEKGWSYADLASPKVMRANIGHYYIDGAYGGYALNRHVNDGGGCRVILERCTARELYDQMHAFLRGFEAGEKHARKPLGAMPDHAEMSHA